MFVRGEGDQYPPIGKGGHPPLQAFLGPGCSGTNTRTHFMQFLLSFFGGGMDVLGDTFRSRFFGTHGFILSQLAPPKTPLRQIVIKQSAWLLTMQLNTVSPVLASLTYQAIPSPLLVPQVCPMLLALTRAHCFLRRFWPASIMRLPTDRYALKSN